MVHTSEKVRHRSLRTKQKLDQLLDKEDMDRNHKLKHAMKCLWNDTDSQKASSTLSKVKLVNQRQKKVYQRVVLDVSQRRSTQLTPAEIKTLNLLRLIVDGGWAVDREVAE